MSRFPWGDGPAPPQSCHRCGRTIGKRRLHGLFEGGLLLCTKCSVLSEGSKSLHTEYYPECPHDWHDMYRQGGRAESASVIPATRAGCTAQPNGATDDHG
ncbi:hypothetical protein MGAD_14120 [Mycolicibacterium gadium]|uniref:Uncharacterized protein n=1 Tax=Mycolicibacterium gadium TaxID=1794 RepID=A0A7I7WJS6_MYCGU|nr:hypothetical protein MGAD_14120 [Mycolicibacterium gadium]